MKLLMSLLIGAGIASAQPYTATSLAAAPFHFVNLMGLNSNGDVLGDTCDDNSSCVGVHRFSGVWSSGVITPLPIPLGYVYVASLQSYYINDSGAVVGTVQEASSSRTHVVTWIDGSPTVLPDDDPLPGCSGIPSSYSSGLNGVGHIVGLTGYHLGTHCSTYWIYDGSNFRRLPAPVPDVCNALPPGYYPGVNFGLPALNDADQVVLPVNNVFCGPPYIPPPGFPAADPALIQTDGSYSFLPLGTLAAATSTFINNVGNVLGFYTAPTHVVVWDDSGVHDLGPSGYAHLNNVSQVIYLGASRINIDKILSICRTKSFRRLCREGCP
jgi:hypothetical protein